LAGGGGVCGAGDQTVVGSDGDGGVQPVPGGGGGSGEVPGAGGSGSHGIRGGG
jgi:hypothetical protein